MAIRDYTARFCDQTPFIGRRWAYDPEKEKYGVRLFEGRLQVKPDKMFAELSTPNGIPVLWAHGEGSAPGNGGWFGFGAAIGRVKSMEFSGTALLGDIALSEDDVMQFVPGGLVAVEAGINAGLSVGLQFLDNPPVTWKLGDGTREKPDLLTYEAVRIIEVSMTPVPRLYTAGIIARVGGDEPTAQEETE